MFTSQQPHLFPRARQMLSSWTASERCEASARTLITDQTVAVWRVKQLQIARCKSNWPKLSFDVLAVRPQLSASSRYAPAVQRQLRLKARDRTEKERVPPLGSDRSGSDSLGAAGRRRDSAAAEEEEEEEDDGSQVWADLTGTNPPTAPLQWTDILRLFTRGPNQQQSWIFSPWVKKKQDTDYL